MAKNPRVWFTRDAWPPYDRAVHLEAPKLSDTGHYWRHTQRTTSVCDEWAKRIGLKLAPGQCVEYELRPVAKKRKPSKPAKAGR